MPETGKAINQFAKADILTKTAAPIRRRWRMFLPVLLVIVLGAAWSGGWFYAAGKAETLIEAALAREAERGRILDCSNKAVSGFPFRIVFDCGKPNLKIARGDVQADFTAAHLKAAVQVYQPNHVIAELTGPLTVAGGGITGEGNWRSAQASVRLAPDKVDQIDVAVSDLTVSSSGADKPHASASHAEAHLRRTPDSTTRDFDIALLADGLALTDPLLPPQLTGFQRAELAGTVRAVPPGVDENATKSLKLWQQNQGRLEIGRLWLDTGEAAVLASGTLALEESGRPSGTLKAALANAPALVGNSAAGPLQLVTAAMQFLGKRVEVEGRKAVEINVGINDGMLKIGPAKLGPLPPLY